MPNPSKPTSHHDFVIAEFNLVSQLENAPNRNLRIHPIGDMISGNFCGMLTIKLRK